MSYFTSSSIYESMEQARQHLEQLHAGLHARMQVQNLDLHIYRDRGQKIVTGGSTTTRDEHNALALQYARSKTEARRIERLMGLGIEAASTPVQVRRHPTIEIRLTPTAFCIELVLSPEAWWDQQNLMGKLNVQRHRESFYAMLRRLDPRYRQGFWHGTDLSDMHIASTVSHNDHVLREWFNTFEPRQDYFRLGIWYADDDAALQGDAIHDEIMQQIKTLYRFYGFLLWTSDNNYRDFAPPALT